MTTVAKAKKTLEKFRPSRLEAKEAFMVAAGYFRDLFPDAAKANMMLEEIEESEDGKYWLITLGYDVVGTIRDLLHGGKARAYKRFTIDQNTGKVISVKIRPLT